MKRIDTVVIGAGPGGYVAAIRLAQLGVEVAIIEKGRMGGVCLNVGCIPSKAYIHAAKVYHEIQRAEEIGISTGAPTVDLARTREWKDGIVSRLTEGVGALLAKAGATSISGTATFTSPNTLDVAGADGSTESIEFVNALIATGSSSLDIPPFPRDGVDVISSTESLDLDAVPERLVVVGGGVIGLEIGMYLQRFGAQLIVVEMLDQLLPGTDTDVVKQLTRILKKRGTKIHTSTKAHGFEKTDKGLVVSIENQKGKMSTVVGDKILVAVGRRPNTSSLGLAAAGVAVDEQGFIPIDERLRTSAPNIFAIGDCTAGPLLAHRASKQGTVAAAVIAGKKDIWDVRALPAAIFTDPEIASVGLTEAEAIDAGHEVITGKFPFSALGRALSMGETEGFIKLVSDAKDDRVLGCHIIGPGASDLIAEAALAIEMGATTEDIALTIHTHPTLAEGMMEAAEAVHGMAVHMFNPKK